MAVCGKYCMRLYDLLNELTFKGSPCTKDCSGHKAGYAWGLRNKRAADSWSPSFNKGSVIAQKPKPKRVVKAVKSKLAQAQAQAKATVKKTKPTIPTR